jgi:formate dehydrogenase major subunit
MFSAMERGELTMLYVLGENPADSEADRHHALKLLGGLEFLLVQDLFYTKTAELADVVLPAAAGWCESDGTVTSSERRVQRVRRAVPPPAGVRDDTEIIFDLARRLGHDWGGPDAETIWNELRTLSPMHAGMSYRRLEELGGIQWPCYDESHPGEMFLHGRLWADPLIGPRAPFSLVEFEPPVDQLDEQYPIRLTTGRRLDSFNTGVQTERYPSPMRHEETLDLSPEDGKHYHLREGERVRLSS